MPIPAPMIEVAIQLARRSELCLCDPDFKSKVGWTSNDVGDFLAMKTSLNDPDPIPAHATLFAEVSRTNYRADPYGSYRPGNLHFNDSIDKCKLRMQIKAITHPAQLAFSDFIRARQNLDVIHRLNYPGGSIPKLGTPIKNGEISVSHSLFEKILHQAPPAADEQEDEDTEVTETHVNDDNADANAPSATESEDQNGAVAHAANDTNDDEAEVENGIDAADDTTPSPTVPDQVDNVIDAADDTPVTPTAPEAPSPWDMEGWPVEGQWREEMLALRGKYNLCPLVVYDGLDEDAEPLLPSQYETRLPGAVVKIVLSFRSFKFGNHALTADIEEIRILAAPLPRQVSPKKRRFQQLISGSSPSKKAKIA